MRLLGKTFAVIVASVFLVTCGLDENYFLPPIPEENVQITSSNTRVRIRLEFKDSSNYEYYLSGFRLYYRIYISDVFETAAIETEAQRSSINPSLQSNFRSLAYYTDVTGTTVNTANMANVFSGQKFYELEVDKANIADILDRKSLNKTIFLDTSRNIPILEFDTGTSHRLLRSTGEKKFKPLPENRYFINTPDLCDSDNAKDPEINADVANTTSEKEFPDRYTYAAFYILVTGINQSNLVPIYSIPTFVGILRLPEE